MTRALVILAAFLTTSSLPAFSQACGDEGRYFHLVPPDYSIPSHRRRAIHRWAKAIRWYKEHNGDKPLCVNGKPVP